MRTKTKWIIFISLSFLLFFGINSVQAAVAAADSDGFELGDADLTNGDGAFWDSGYAVVGTASLVGNESLAGDVGTYSAKGTIGAVSSSARAYSVIDTTTDNYMQFRFNITSHVGGAGANCVIAMMNNTNTQRNKFTIMRASASTFTINLVYTYDGGSTTLTGTTTFNNSTWYTAEMRFKTDPAAGGAQYWINGVLEGSNIAQDTQFSTGNKINRFTIGVASSSTDSTAAIYFDEVKYGTSYMGVDVAVATNGAKGQIYPAINRKTGRKW